MPRTSISLAGFNSDSTALVRLAEDYGWEFRRTSNGHAIGKAPDGVTTISIGPHSRPGNRGYQNSLSELRRWIKAQGEDDPLVQQVIAADVKGVGSVGQALIDTVTRREAESSTALDGDTQSVEPDFIVSPRIVIQGGGQTKQSHAANVRTDPEGNVIDYICALPGCGYTAPTGKQVAMHYGAKHTRKDYTKRSGSKPHERPPVESMPNGVDPLPAPTWEQPITDMSELLDQIGVLIALRYRDVEDELAALKAERDAAVAALAKYRENLAAATDLLGGL